MSDPYKIDGPAVVNFSGGKTSGKLLWECAKRGFSDDVFVLFENTGKERKETLDFVHRVGSEWGIGVTYLERLPRADKIAQSADLLFEIGAIDRETQLRALTYCSREVTYETASRDGEPFAQLIAEHDYLPNPITRYCTTEMKTLTVERWMRARGYEHWTEVMGLRADEPARVARMRNGAGRKYREIVCPLYDAYITKEDVDAFWRAQPFTLELRSWEGNCDLCHLKGLAKIKRILRDRPDLAAWWIEQERIGRPRAKLATFRNDRPAYAALLETVQLAKATQPMFAFADDDAEPESDLDDLDCGVCVGAA